MRRCSASTPRPVRSPCWPTPILRQSPATAFRSPPPTPPATRPAKPCPWPSPTSMKSPRRSLQVRSPPPSTRTAARARSFIPPRQRIPATPPPAAPVTAWAARMRRCSASTPRPVRSPCWPTPILRQSPATAFRSPPPTPPATRPAKPCPWPSPTSMKSPRRSLQVRSPPPSTRTAAQARSFIPPRQRIPATPPPAAPVTAWAARMRRCSASTPRPVRSPCWPTPILRQSPATAFRSPPPTPPATRPAKPCPWPSPTSMKSPRRSLQVRSPPPSTRTAAQARSFIPPRQRIPATPPPAAPVTAWAARMRRCSASTPRPVRSPCWPTPILRQSPVTVSR